MTYDEAAKKVRAEKPQENFVIMEFRYDAKFVLPHKAGVALLEAMANAELLKDGYCEPRRIVELDRDSFSNRTMSRKEYDRFKIAALLNITPDEVREAEELAIKQQNQPAPS